MVWMWTFGRKGKQVLKAEKQCFLGAVRDPGSAHSPAAVLSEPLVPSRASSQIPSSPAGKEKKQLLLVGRGEIAKDIAPRMSSLAQDRPTDENR